MSTAPNRDWRNWVAGALCLAAAAVALDTALSGAEFRGSRAKLQNDLAAVAGLERGDPAAAAWRERVERSAGRGGAHAPDVAAALADAGLPAAAEAPQSEPLGGGWSRKEIAIRAHGADFAALGLLAERLSGGDPAWRLRSAEWTAGPGAGRGEALLVLEALDFAPEGE